MWARLALNGVDALSKGQRPGPARSHQGQAHFLGSTPLLPLAPSSLCCVPWISAQTWLSHHTRSTAALSSCLIAKRSFCSCFPLSGPGSPGSRSADLHFDL